MPTNKPEVVLPELPEPIGNKIVMTGDDYQNDYVFFTAAYNTDQLRSYGQACIDALHDKVLIFLHHLEDVMDEHPEVEGWIDHKLWNAISLRSATRVDTLTRPADGEYDRELIAEMLDDLLRAEAAAEERGTTEGRSYFNRDAIAEQAQLLRAADNRDTAGVRTANLSAAPQQPAEAVAPDEWDEQKSDAWSDFETDYLTDGNGYAPADTYKACTAAFSAAWPDRAAAHAAAKDAYEKLHPHSVAVEFYRRNPSAALQDFRKRVNPPPAIDIGKSRELVAKWRKRASAYGHAGYTGVDSEGRSGAQNECADELAALSGDGGEVSDG